MLFCANFNTLELRCIGRSSVSSGVIVFLNNFFFSCRSEFVHSFLSTGYSLHKFRQIQKIMSINQQQFSLFRTNKEKKFCWVRWMPSLLKINEENCDFIPETRHSVCSRHSNDKGEISSMEVLNIECLCVKSGQLLNLTRITNILFLCTQEKASNRRATKPAQSIWWLSPLILHYSRLT